MFRQRALRRAKRRGGNVIRKETGVSTVAFLPCIDIPDLTGSTRWNMFSRNGSGVRWGEIVFARQLSTTIRDFRFCFVEQN